MIGLVLGILCGIALSLFFSFGPAFFSQIRTSIQYGFRKSYPFAFGVSLGDIIIVFLMLTVLKNADLNALLHNVWVASIGGAVMVIMGIYFFRKEVKDLDEIQDAPPHLKFRKGDVNPRLKFRCTDGEPRRLYILFQGFIINFVNPTIWIYWVSIIALITGEFNMVGIERYIFFIGVLGSTLGMDILKCKLASLLQKIVTAKVLNITNKVCGVILFAFAAYLVGSMIVFQIDKKEGIETEENVKQTEMIKNIHSRLDSNMAQVGKDTAVFKPLRQKHKSHASNNK